MDVNEAFFHIPQVLLEAAGSVHGRFIADAGDQQVVWFRQADESHAATCVNKAPSDWDFREQLIALGRANPGFSAKDMVTQYNKLQAQQPHRQLKNKARGREAWRTAASQMPSKFPPRRCAKGLCPSRQQFGDAERLSDLFVRRALLPPGVSLRAPTWLPYVR